MEKTRDGFKSRTGFVIACIGSAVGMGNIWRFPYMVSDWGGMTFLIPYVLFVILIGASGVIEEMALGRAAKGGPIIAFGKCTEVRTGNKKIGERIGIIPVIGSLALAIGYTVVVGWIFKYTFLALSGQLAGMGQDMDAIGGMFGTTATKFGNNLWLVVAVIVTAVIMAFGIAGGIERANKIMMPLLFVLFLGLGIYIFTLPGASAGIKYYLLPDFTKFSLKTVCAAMGQMFYSMSLAMGIMVTYGSYTKNETSLTKSVNQIEIFDTVVALLAGFMVVPAVYVFSGEAGTKASGAGLMFVTLPKVFEQMRGGTIIGILFFVLVFLAALTSSISIMEAIVSSFMDRFGISRKKSVAVCIIISIIMGIPSSLGNGAWAHIKILGMDFLTFFDYISNSVLMPIVALCTCILIGWAAGAKTVTDEVKRNGEKMNREKLYNVMIKYIAPVMLVIILITYSMAQFGFFTM